MELTKRDLQEGNWVDIVTDEKRQRLKFVELAYDYPTEQHLARLVDSSGEPGLYSFEQLEPIVLTKKVLLAFGFEQKILEKKELLVYHIVKGDKENLIKARNYSVLIEESGRCLLWRKTTHYGSRIQYLHELQNFIYLLDKHNLELKHIKQKAQ